MRKKENIQPEFDYLPSRLKITNDYFERYDAISEILDGNPEIINRIHRDLKKLFKKTDQKGPGRHCVYTSETILRIVICQIIEGESLRGIIIRIDDSNYLRRFVRIYHGPMLDYSTFCKLRNAIQPKTWKKINELLTRSAVDDGKIGGERLRLDTTAFETNIHYPTDSSLLWDVYRVLCRLIRTVREIDPEAASDKRLRPKAVKRLHTEIARLSGKKQNVSEKQKDLYIQMIAHVGRLLAWVPNVCGHLRAGLVVDIYEVYDGFFAEATIEQIEHFRMLGLRVVDQAQRRVLGGETVPNDEKIFSIFEPHTELLIRGKAGKPIEFGHMIALQQVEEKFITDYEVFKKRPIDSTLVDPALQSHRKAFGENPKELSGDKGYYESMSKIKELEEEIEVVSIGKKGKRSEEETARETSPAFKLGQRFRAGIEGSISFLKRVLGMWRCMNKGWEHYVSTVGATVFVHNLLVLANGSG